MGRFIDLSGNIYGRWTAIKVAGRSNRCDILWLCRCRCGKEKVVSGNSLRKNASKSCGCLQREIVSRLSKQRCGSKATGWKGGKYKNKAGYVYLHKPKHLRANNGGYVLEHIYLMSKHIGRTVLKDEAVHHKNGVKDDNRIENLELWIRSHPSGQRVCDMVAYAKSILQRYEHLAL